MTFFLEFLERKRAGKDTLNTKNEEKMEEKFCSEQPLLELHIVGASCKLSCSCSSIFSIAYQKNNMKMNAHAISINML